MKKPPQALRYLAALFSGVVLMLVSPPIGLDALHWFTFVPLLLALDPEDRRLNFRLGYLCGFAGVFCLFFWLAQTIVLFSNFNLASASIVVVIFAAVWGIPYGILAMLVHPLRRRFGDGWVFLFPAVWVASEYLQPALFPYFQGVGQYRNPYTWQIASVFGAMGLTYLVVLTNAAIAAFFMNRRERTALPITAVAVAIVLFASNLAFGKWRYDHVEAILEAAPVKHVAILQQHVTMTERLRDSGRTAFRSWVALTQKLAEQEHPDLVVWPEGAIPFNPHEGKARDLLSAMVKQGNFWFLAGGGTSSPDPTNVENAIHWNSAYLFSPDGEVAGRYDKMVPLPFGEYLPWPFSYLRPYIEGVGNFRAGSTPHVFSAGDFTFTTPICYEAILESQMRRLMDADLFVNITNDGWFGDTAAPRQHAMLAAVQAMEFGRPMVRIAYTGISMIVEPHGRILYETKPYTDVSEVVPLRLGKVDTPYRSWGGWFPPICSLVAVGAVFAAVRRERSTAAVTPRIAAS